MIARTGNDTGVSASDSELVFRNLLDRPLRSPPNQRIHDRPPRLTVGIGLLGRPNARPARRPCRRVGGALLMAGAMGQTSIVNTLTHPHIPVVLSLARDGLDCLSGVLFGQDLGAIVPRSLPTGEEA